MNLFNKSQPANEEEGKRRRKAERADEPSVAARPVSGEWRRVICGNHLSESEFGARRTAEAKGKVVPHSESHFPLGAGMCHERGTRLFKSHTTLVCKYNNLSIKIQLESIASITVGEINSFNFTGKTDRIPCHGSPIISQSASILHILDSAIDGSCF